IVVTTEFPYRRVDPESFVDERTHDVGRWMHRPVGRAEYEALVVGIRAATHRDEELLAALDELTEPLVRKTGEVVLRPILFPIALGFVERGIEIRRMDMELYVVPRTNGAAELLGDVVEVEPVSTRGLGVVLEFQDLAGVRHDGELRAIAIELIEHARR